MIKAVDDLKVGQTIYYTLPHAMSSFKITKIENGYLYTDKNSVMPIEFYIKKRFFSLDPL